MKLAIFDVDGTLSDSQNHILAALESGFRAAGVPVPGREKALSIVGLSLPEAVAELLPEATEAERLAVLAQYKTSFHASRQKQPTPLYPGARESLDRLAGREDMLLGLATGKSRRGLDALCDYYDLNGYFCTRQCADDHPSKPNPSMIGAALREAGVDGRQAVMIGDTSFDILMGRAAGVHTIGVSWGYHPVASLRAAGADRIVDSFAALELAVTDLLEDGE